MSDTYTPRPGDRVHVFGVRRGTVTAGADPRGYVRVIVDADPAHGLEAVPAPGWSVSADTLRLISRPVPTEARRA